jgi:hypothetical protein
VAKSKIEAGSRCASSVDILIREMRLAESEFSDETFLTVEAETQRLSGQGIRDHKAVGKTFMASRPFQVTRVNGAW